MSELVRSPKRTPKKRTTTVNRTTFKPRAPEGKAPQTRAALFQKLDYIRGELQDQLKAFHNRYTELAHDLKESEANRDFVRKALFGFGSRLSDLEKRCTAAGIPDLVPPPIESLADWQAKIDAAVERLKELPDPCTPMQLAAHFAVQYVTVQKLWLNGRLPVTRDDGGWITITREAITQYVRIYGVPCMRHKRAP